MCTTHEQRTDVKKKNALKNIRKIVLSSLFFSFFHFSFPKHDRNAYEIILQVHKDCFISFHNRYIGHNSYKKSGQRITTPF